MNERIKQLAKQAGLIQYDTDGKLNEVDKFAELIIRECDRLNKEQSDELLGVIIDAEEGSGFDTVCLNTVKRVKDYLAGQSLAKYFEVE